MMAVIPAHSKGADSRKEGEMSMARVALVTGGTRGIGEAISVALHEAGRKVVASYVGNDQAAKSFSEATGIAVIKFDAG